MIIAIDGPAGAGKSTTARALAERFGYAYLNTGAMYRAVALAALEHNLHVPEDSARLEELARILPIELRDKGERVFIGGREVTELINTAEIGAAASRVSTLPGVREAMVRHQQRLAERAAADGGGAVLEGRDIGTVVCPGAEVKVFLSAGQSTRVARRLQQWRERGEAATAEAAQRDVSGRDASDSTREASPLQAALDAHWIDSDQLSQSEVVEQIAALVREKLTALHKGSPGERHP